MKYRQAGQAAIALVIDGDPSIRLLARDALEKLGLQVEEANGGASGLSSIAALGPDIILLGVMMSDMDGFAVCRQALLIPGAELTPILMLTAPEDSDSIHQAYEAGATDFIGKPIDWPILGHRVRYMLKASDLLRDVVRSDFQLAKARRLTSVGSWEWRVEPDSTTWSEEMYRICGVRSGTFEQTHQGFLALVHPADRPQIETALRETLEQGGAYDVEHRLLRPDGTERIVHGKAEVMFDADGRPVLLSGTLQDITQRKRMEARIGYLTNYDALTNLPNRTLLNDRVTQSISLARRTGQQLAMLCLDLDGFKFINDGFGHAVGDSLLKMVAARLKGAIRECDTVARLGGDEFVLVLLGLADDGRDVGSMAQRVLDTFAQSFIADAHELHVTASIGVSVFPDDGDTHDVLLKNADAAMYDAKDRGRNCFQFYAQEMSLRAKQRVTLANALRTALERQQFEVHYQPKVDLRSGRVSGVEALLRWRHPEHGMVQPDSFIGLAEETRLIVPIGEWVLRTACAQTRKWHDMGFDDLSVAVNLSVRQFEQQDIAQLVRQVLAETGLAARHLELELTESVLMSDSDVMLKALREIKELGVVLTLDDFGTGYSSLSYLKRFPIDVLKIDRSFIRNVTTDADDASLTKGIILLAQSLKMKTVAEGVETQGQLGFLSTNKCDAVQGFYFSRPVAADALSAMLQSNVGLPVMPETAGRQRTVLLLDDEPSVLSALARLFRQDDYQILQAHTPAEGFELLATHKVQVIVSDQRMPSMTGTAFLGKVKELYPDTIRIILSGYTELTSVIDAINGGAVYRFFTKPWDDQVLRDQLREAFEHHWLIHGKPMQDRPSTTSDSQCDEIIDMRKNGHS
ncbi:MAG: EAL domain-containing protein [Oxalobacteraceae bacterium]|nr:EAL domain-containing protein [Oxalobacteraceae bacterium]